MEKSASGDAINLHRGKEGVELKADERLLDLLQGERDGFMEVIFDGEEGGSAIFKGSFVPGLPHVVEECDKDGCHEFEAGDVVAFGEKRPDCSCRENWRDLDSSCMQKQAPDGNSHVT